MGDKNIARATARKAGVPVTPGSDGIVETGFGLGLNFLATWDAWRADSGRDVYVYFDNDAKVHAPYDAIALAERLS